MTRPTLSICIPIYNFAAYVPATLRSILANEGVGDVEIVVVDGASTDDTADVIGPFLAANPNIRFIRLAEKGGIDRDMATAAGFASGDYVWLFSGDDLMRPDALKRLREKLASGADLYLCKHLEATPDMTPTTEWPVLKGDIERIYRCGEPRDRRAYLSAGTSTEGCFSFMGNLIVRKAMWDRIALDERFVGTCFAHSARLLDLMKHGLVLHYVPEAWLIRRPDNDSFLTKGLVERMRLGIEGFHQIGDALFGHRSPEAYAIREMVRCDFSVHMMLYGKYLCWLRPAIESRPLMDRLVRTAYDDLSWRNLRTRYRYWRTSIDDFRREYPHIVERDERRRVETGAPARA